ncbi:uncharacterized protein LOC107274889 isoform X2 [Cephus cinctus]|uniref:Uncharacterized protein LOC107274889 isoform X2 n=1 Tax=Cephus cinctus TaxID=211228 RepID=A0AAJ7R7L7_CEPCN|nr:uncharacterized protein LOC107274889 isoform X2 [Cephus cinctus]
MMLRKKESQGDMSMDGKSKSVVECDSVNGIQGDKYLLSPIEEETESVISSRATSVDYSDSEVDDEDYSRTSRTDASREEESMRIERQGIQDCGDRKVEVLKKPPGTTSDTGENRKQSLRAQEVMECLKQRVTDSENEIINLRRELNLEKAKSREFALQCQKENNSNPLRIDLESWKDEFINRSKCEISRWQQNERKRLDREISRITELLSQKITRTFKRSLKDWHAEESKKTSELIQKERNRQEIDAERTKKSYERLQRHLENLERRNKKSYVTFRKQIDNCESRLKDEIVDLHEKNFEKFKNEVKHWNPERRNTCYQLSLPKTDKSESNINFEKSSKDDRSIAKENLFSKLLECVDRNDLRRIEENLKMEIEINRKDQSKRMNEKICELWIAFEEFTHNFTLNRHYSNETQNVANDPMFLDSDSIYSETFCDIGTKSSNKSNAIDTSTDTNIKEDPTNLTTSKSNPGFFGKNSLVNLPIVPQVRDDKLKKK